jgi:hypothetical protein
VRVQISTVVPDVSSLLAGPGLIATALKVTPVTFRSAEEMSIPTARTTKKSVSAWVVCS